VEPSDRGLILGTNAAVACRKWQHVTGLYLTQTLIRLRVHLIHSSMAVQPIVVPWPRFQFIYTQSVGFLGIGISQSEGRYLHTGQHKPRINAHTDIHALSGIHTHERTKTLHTLNSAATVIGSGTPPEGKFTHIQSYYSTSTIRLGSPRLKDTGSASGTRISRTENGQWIPPKMLQPSAWSVLLVSRSLDYPSSCCPELACELVQRSVQ
jgi:hypothetical protein